MLPTFATVAMAKASAVEGVRGFDEIPGLSFDLAMMLHGEEEIILHQPLPKKSRCRMESRIGPIYDKGKAAIFVLEGDATDESGAPLFSTRSSMFVRGEGGFGGEAAPDVKNGRPDRPPDGRIERPTLPNQALLYRLTGDMNPLHADPKFAAQGGFDAPILHGMCSYGVVCKAIVDEVLKGDVARVGGFSARFAGVFFPGETYEISHWEEGDRILVEASCKERGTPVISNAAISLR